MGVPPLNTYTTPETPTCIGLYHRRNLDAGGRRHSAYHAFLPKSLVLRRRNLTICVGATVQRILFSDSTEKLTANGVLVENNQRQQFIVRAKHEIILSAGAVVTPQLLLLRCHSYLPLLIVAVWVQKITSLRYKSLAFMIFLESALLWYLIYVLSN
jgi:choline dehydrogenase-like flavoprotein